MPVAAWRLRRGTDGAWGANLVSVSALAMATSPSFLVLPQGPELRGSLSASRRFSNSGSLPLPPSERKAGLPQGGVLVHAPQPAVPEVTSDFHGALSAGTAPRKPLNPSHQPPLQALLLSVDTSASAVPPSDLRRPAEAVLTGSRSLPATREANVETVEQSPHRVLLGHTRNVQCQVPVAHAAPSRLMGEANEESMERSLYRVLLGHTRNVQCQAPTAHTAPLRLMGGAAPTPRVPVLQAAALALGSSGLWADGVCVWHEALAGVVNPARLWPLG
ncbi:uncharacterized protein LOC111551024 [Piliocolobus tephrosceles]|uniref:uncharacterized protein LOC111551024 n=1 Tax=Piliocolobus tephrosceles TaxID=591936 RepID=UPI000C2A435B|nr:uncharacterized protein LOC111551024 [Piliocolobus tephrosceles]